MLKYVFRETFDMVAVTADCIMWILGRDCAGNSCFTNGHLATPDNSPQRSTFRASIRLGTPPEGCVALHRGALPLRGVVFGFLRRDETPPEACFASGVPRIPLTPPEECAALHSGSSWLPPEGVKASVDQMNLRRP